MSVELKLSSLFFLITFSLFAFKTSLETATLSCMGIMLLALVIYVERTKTNSTQHLEKQIKDLSDRVDGLNLQRGLGR